MHFANIANICTCTPVAARGSCCTSHIANNENSGCTRVVAQLVARGSWKLQHNANIANIVNIANSANIANIVNIANSDCTWVVAELVARGSPRLQQRDGAAP